MANLDPADLRTIAFVGHASCGKTTLAEVILNKTGVINRIGDIKEGNTVCDYEDEEKSREHSINNAVVRFPYQGKEVICIDTPGYPEFVGAAISALSAVDLAILLVDATAGVRVNTRRVFDEAKKAGVPVFFVISRMDGEHAKFEEALGQCQETFGRCIPLYRPEGSGSDFSGVTSVLDNEDDPGYSELLEAIVEADEDLMTAYLEGEEITKEQLGGTFLTAVRDGVFYPVVPLAALKEAIGVDALLDTIVNYGPSPAEIEKNALQGEGEEAEEVVVTADKPFTGFVFKSMTDAFVGKLSFFRVFSGTVESGATVVDNRVDKPLKLGKIYRVVGEDQVDLEKAVAGEIVAVSKVDELTIGDTLASSDFPVTIPEPDYPRPMVAQAITSKKRGDEEKIITSLTKLADEDKTFTVERDIEVNEQVIRGLSALHLDVVLSRLKERFNVEVDTSQPRIAYRETITSRGDARYRHKKQTGGAGQFAEVWMRIEPLPRGEGYEFENEVVGGAISQGFMPSIEKGIKQVMKDGIVAGYPVVDVKAVVYDGKEHPVDSKDIAFQIAGRGAFKEAFQQAKPVLLEPIDDVWVTIPNSYMGDIIGDLNSRRGRIQNTETKSQHTTIHAKIPRGEMATYSQELRSMTGGEGSYTMGFSHYDVVPSNVAQTIIAEARAREKDD